MTHDTTLITPTGPSTEGRVAHFFGLRGDAWMRHANPRSVWTRFTCVSLVVIAVWSRVWIGWYCLIPIALASVWTWFNPHLFGAPTSTRNWASKSVFGERIWTDRRNTKIPDQFTSRVRPGQRLLVHRLGEVVYGVSPSTVLTIAGIVIVHGGSSVTWTEWCCCSRT